MGGPMMGLAVYDTTYPLLKNNNAILAFDESQVREELETTCIRCGPVCAPAR
jgi:electron transport complex protein RnfC